MGMIPMTTRRMPRAKQQCPKCGTKDRRIAELEAEKARMVADYIFWTGFGDYPIEADSES
jgi:transposase